MNKIRPVEKGKPGSLLETERANEVIGVVNALSNMKVIVDPSLSPNGSRLEYNGNSFTLVIGIHK